MTRILYWNINNFSLNKIADPAHLADAHDRRAHIVDEVLRGLQTGAGAAALPDIFVVVEVYARVQDVGTEGMPLTGNAQVGVMALLNHIRLRTLNAAWMLVPPVWSGMYSFGEGIAVFYNSNNLAFTGPYVFGPDYRTATQRRSGAWNSPPVQRACRLGDTVPPAGTPALPGGAGWIQGVQNYPGAWAGCLPNRAGAAGAPMEDELAGQYEFYNAAGRIYFPYNFHRSPFLTTFDDLTGAGAGRSIRLFSMHTTPGFANQAVQRLPNVAELVPAANEVTVVVGDFNADTFDSRAAYNGLVGAVGGPAGPMVMAFRPEDAGAIRASRRPYCLTHMLPTGTATPNGVAGGVAASPTQNVYPRFGYMGTMGGLAFRTPRDSAAIDNILTRYVAPAGGAPAAPANATIVNTVTGKPYGAAGAIANVTAELTGGLTTPSRLANAIPQPAGEDSTAGGAAGITALFQTWPNLGRIRSTSDHLALSIDV